MTGKVIPAGVHRVVPRERVPRAAIAAAAAPRAARVPGEPVRPNLST
ncbi:hypothetical protein FHT40_003861 [Mycolicibacterium sp. BK556]|nr:MULTISPECIES: hypothetical protein [unclassified Mycolicibacterium]MBB3604200.1 hypothetical protein [Mycolicibacterium sp. BK556]MBB3634396.1 hypothetical protein [Mycolicibacterium sp. BK607]